VRTVRRWTATFRTLIRPAAPADDAPVTPLTDPGGGRAVVRYSLRTGRRDLIASGTFTAVHQAAETAVPIAIGVIIDHAVARHDPAALLIGLAGLAAVFGVLTFSMRIGLRMGVRGIEGTAHALRVLLTRRVLHPRGIAGEDTTPGNLLSVAATDAPGVGFYNSAVRRIIGAIGALVVATVALMTVSPPLGLFILLGLPPWLWLMRRLAGPVIRHTGAQRATAADASHQAADYLRGLRVLAGIGAGTTAARRFHHTSDHARHAAVRAATARAVYDGVNTVLTGVFLAVVALFAGILADHGTISVGQVVMAVGLAASLIAPFATITAAIRVVAAAKVSAERVATVLGAPYATAGGGTPAAPPEGPVGLDIPPGIAVRPGELLGVAAGDPADATRIIDLLARRTDPPPGTLLLGGADVTGMDPVSVRAAVVVSFHHTDLFTGSVADNVLAAAPPDRLAPALAAAAADDIRADAPVSEHGLSLSSGQRQRVALARALAADPPVLVLHDPTSAVDAATEARVAAGIRTARAGRTTILITTSPGLLAVTDRVTVIHDGHPTADGTHAALLSTDPAYRDLVLR
jgi:putative ABC transport system ATP-binding protein